MNEIIDLALSIFNGVGEEDPGSGRILTEEQNQAAVRAAAMFVANEDNRESFTDVLYALMPPLELSQTTATQTAQKTYIFFILLTAISRECPDCFDEEDFNDKRFTIKEEQISMVQLVFLVTTTCLINERDSVQNIQEVFPTSILFGDELYAFREPLMKYYQPFTLGSTELLSKSNRILAELIFDFLALVRGRELVQEFEQYIFYSLKELSVILRAESSNLLYGQSTYMDALKMREQAEVIILGNMLGALASGISQEFCEAGLSGEENSELVEEAALCELAAIIVKIAQYYMYGAEVCEEAHGHVLNEVYEANLHEEAPRDVSFPQDVLKTETYHYFICSTLLPFYATCSEIGRCCVELKDIFNYEACYCGVVKFGKAIDFVFAAGHVRKVDGVETAERCQELFYFDMFRLLTLRKDWNLSINSITSMKLLTNALSPEPKPIPANKIALYLVDKGAVLEISEYYLLLHYTGHLDMENIFSVMKEVDKMQKEAGETKVGGNMDSIGYLFFVHVFNLLTQFSPCERLLLCYCTEQDLLSYLELQELVQRDQYFSCVRYVKAHALKPVKLCVAGKETRFEPPIKPSMSAARASLQEYLDGSLYNHISAVTRAAGRSEEIGKAIIAGNAVLLSGCDFLQNIRISSLDASLLLMSIFTVSDEGFQRKYVSVLCRSSEGVRVAVVDIVGTAVLSYENGYSLAQALLYENAISDAEVEDLEMPLLPPDIGLNLERSILAFEKQFHEMNCQQPHRFLNQLSFLAEMQMGVLLAELKFVQPTDFANSFLSLPQDCEYNSNQFFISLFNAASIYAYLVGSWDEFSEITALQRRLRNEFSLSRFESDDLLQNGFWVLARCARLKLCLLEIMQEEDASSAAEELQNLFELLHIDIQNRLDALKYQRNMMDDEALVNASLIASLFIAMLHNEVCGGRLKIAAKWVKTENFLDVYNKFSDLSQNNYGENMILDKPGVDSMIALFAFFSDRVYDEVTKMDDEIVLAIERFYLVSEYGTDRSQLDYAISNKLLYWSAAFYCASKCYFSQKSCKDWNWYLMETLSVFTKIMSDTCKEEIISYEHEKEQLTQVLNLIFVAFYDFLVANKALLQEIDSQQIYGEEHKTIYYILLKAIMKLTQLYNLDGIVQPSCLIQKELIQLLPAREEASGDLLNLLCRLSVSLEISSGELLEIIQNGAIGSDDPKDLMLSIRQSDNPFNLSATLLEACLFKKRHYVCGAVYCSVEGPKMSHFDRRNVHLLPLPLSLILAFRFHPLLQSLATDAIEYVWNCGETFEVSQTSNKAAGQLMAVYQDFQLSNLCADRADTFSREIFICIEKALVFIFTAGILEDDESSYQFLDAALGEIDFGAPEAYCRDWLVERNSGVAAEGLSEAVFRDEMQSNLQLNKADSDVRALIFRLMLALASQHSNFEMMLDYALNRLLPGALARVSDREESEKLFLLLQILFIYAPLPILELYIELSGTNIAEAYTILLTVTHQSPQGETLLLEYFMLRYLDFGAQFAGLLDEYEFAEKLKYCMAHQDVLTSSLGSDDTFNVYLRKFMQRQRIDDFPQRFEGEIAVFEHAETVLVVFAISTMLLQVLTDKEQFQAVLTSYVCAFRRRGGKLASGTSFGQGSSSTSIFNNYGFNNCCGGAAASGNGVNGLNHGSEQHRANGEFSQAFYCTYRAAMDAFSIVLAPAYTRAAAQLQIQTVLSQSDPGRAQFSTGAFYLIYILRRLVFALNTCCIASIDKFRCGTYIQDVESTLGGVGDVFHIFDRPSSVVNSANGPQAVNDAEEANSCESNIKTQPSSANSEGGQQQYDREFRKAYMREAVILRQAFYLPAAEETVMRILGVSARLVDSRHVLRPEVVVSGVDEHQVGCVWARGQYSSEFWMQQIAFLLQMATEMFEQLVNPEELCDSGSTSEFRELLRHARYAPAVAVFESLETITLGITHVATSAQNYCYVAFSSILDNIEILMQTPIQREIVENYIVRILSDLALACPVRPAIARVIADFLRFEETGHKISVEGELLCCIGEEEAFPAAISETIRVLALKYPMTLDDVQLEGMDWYECAVEHYKLREIKAALQGLK